MQRLEAAGEAGVVHQHVDGRRTVEGSSDGSVHGGAVADIDLNQMALAAELGCQSAKALDATGGEDEIRAARAQRRGLWPFRFRWKLR